MMPDSSRFVLASGADLWAIQEIPIDYTTERFK